MRISFKCDFLEGRVYPGHLRFPPSLWYKARDASDLMIRNGKRFVYFELPTTSVECFPKNAFLKAAPR